MVAGHRMLVTGFEDRAVGRCRVVVRDLVGGRSVKTEPWVTPELQATTGSSGGESEYELWSWKKDVAQSAGASKAEGGRAGRWRMLVSRDVTREVPLALAPSPSLPPGTASGTAAVPVATDMNDPPFPPPDGGYGMRVLAKWGYFPKEGVQDELMFPRGAVVQEVEDLNGDWYWGFYAGRGGVFPGGYVRVV